MLSGNEMKLNHAKIILKEERYLDALRVVAEAEAEEKARAKAKVEKKAEAEAGVPEVPAE